MIDDETFSTTEEKCHHFPKNSFANHLSLHRPRLRLLPSLLCRPNPKRSSIFLISLEREFNWRERYVEAYINRIGKKSEKRHTHNSPEIGNALIIQERVKYRWTRGARHKYGMLVNRVLRDASSSNSDRTIGIERVYPISDHVFFAFGSNGGDP